MTKKMLTLNQLVELAIATDLGLLPWDSVNITPETAYGMMAAHVIDLFEAEEEVNREIVMMSVMTKLLVENFLLNLKIQQSNG